MSYAAHFAAYLRLAILRELMDAPEYSLASTMLRDLVAAKGQVTTHDQVKTEILWLSEQGLVEQQQLANVIAATITERGLDVAAGRATTPGVRRPLPGE